MQPIQETAAFFQLLEVVGVPGIVGLLMSPVVILGLLLFIFLRQDQKKWDAIKAEDRERWASLLVNHRAERDRDFSHLKELMDANAGHYDLISKLLTRYEVTDGRIIHLGLSLEKLPNMFRDVHQRFDLMLDTRRKESNARSASHEGPSREGERHSPST
jgi:hypothetical protein